MRSNLKFALGLSLVVAIGIAIAYSLRPDTPAPPATAGDGVVVYLDFQCPACAQTHPVIERLEQEYHGRIEFASRHFPLPGHRHAEAAARAAEAAAQQGKYKEMAALLFQRQAEWGENPDFTRYAASLGLDLRRYEADVASASTKAKIAADKERGTALGVRGTPTIFINGDRFTGQLTYAELKSAIERALKK
ncbi:DsbA family protein [Allorhizocola rhizosphaerae]|uniref:DsbA family protein n=1 Tax=Allorhizocola rhizosphaerae TaxID=1872709 RepID=UPI000E3E9BC6|nr:thioredoxin domain-containing protein [Allorhizocola rhizosphaerae]